MASRSALEGGGALADASVPTAEAERRQLEESIAAFGEMYAALSPQQRRAEIDRLNMTLATEPAGACFDALTWQSLAQAWASRWSRERGGLERQAAELAESALARCSYLGGLSTHPVAAETFGCSCHISEAGELWWADRAGRPVVAVHWTDIVGLRTGATDRGAERVTATRTAAFGLFALGMKKTRQEGMLGVKTSSGEAIFIVHGLSPLALEARLAPLVACVEVPTSDSLQDLEVSGGIDQGLMTGAFGAQRADRDRVLASLHRTR